MTRPTLLDLYSGAGGCAVGYDRAGFDVTGVDIAPQKRYPFRFIQGDALEYVAAHGHEYDAIHASPPCQGYSRMRHLPWLKGKDWPLLIDATRAALDATGLPWVIENVADAPLDRCIILCGTMFNLRVYRHRRFESNYLLLAPPHPRHRQTIGAGSMLNDRNQANDGWVSLLSKADLATASRAVGIDWMTRDELTEAIPPAYTEYIGAQLLRIVQATREGGAA